MPVELAIGISTHAGTDRGAQPSRRSTIGSPSSTSSLRRNGSSAAPSSSRRASLGRLPKSSCMRQRLTSPPQSSRRALRTPPVRNFPIPTGPVTIAERIRGLRTNRSTEICKAMNVSGGTDGAIRLCFSTPLEPGVVHIRISYRASIGNTMVGFFRARYRASTSTKLRDGDSAVVLATHFEPCHARFAFPCFDEPHLKATFDVEIEVPHGLTALGNMPVKRTTKLSGPKHDGLERVEFATTPVMSTYVSITSHPRLGARGASLLKQNGSAPRMGHRRVRIRGSVHRETPRRHPGPCAGLHAARPQQVRLAGAGVRPEGAGPVPGALRGRLPHPQERPRGGAGVRVGCHGELGRDHVQAHQDPVRPGHLQQPGHVQGRVRGRARASAPVVREPRHDEQLVGAISQRGICYVGGLHGC